MSQKVTSHERDSDQNINPCYTVYVLHMIGLRLLGLSYYLGDNLPLLVSSWLRRLRPSFRPLVTSTV
jgi:hypothetical protein